MAPRVAYVISTTSGAGGAERLLLRLVEEGDARGWEQLVLNPFPTEVPSAFTELSRSPRYRWRRCDRLTQLPGLRRWLHGELRAFRPDIVHVMLFHALLTVATLPRRATGPRLLTHVYGEGLRSEGDPRVKTLLDRWAGSRFDRVVAISEAVRWFLVTEYRYPATTVTCIPPGWEGEPLPRDEASRAPTVVCVAGLRPEKGHDVLLAALPLVRRQVPDARLVLVGDGAMRPELEAQAGALGVAGAVEFAGTVPEIWPYLASADVFALASVTEAFGMAILEAMAAGLPVVAPAVGGIPELVVPGVTGELFPPGDHEALAGHLVHLLTSPATRSRMVAEARRTAEPLRMSRTIPRYFELYEEMLATTPPRPAARGGQETVAGERLGIDARSPFWGDHCSRYHFASALCRGRVVLDVACGTGFGAGILSRAGAGAVVGVDMSAEALAGRGATDLRTMADGTQLPFQDASFGVVTSFETIEHLHEPEGFLDELQRVLRHDGVLVLSTPNALYTKPVDGKPANPFHVKEFTPAELQAMLELRFAHVQLLGQAPDRRYRACPYWVLPEHLPADIGGRLEALAWKVESRLPLRARQNLSRLVHRRPLYPGEHDFVFTETMVDSGHVIVALCRP